MNEFEQEVLARRAMTRGARNRVGGSKGRRCTLPSDSLTPAQWKARNGPLQTIRLGAAMSWADYAALDDHMKRLCIQGLLEQVETDRLGEMLGTDEATARQELGRLGLGPAGERRGGNRWK